MCPRRIVRGWRRSGSAREEQQIPRWHHEGFESRMRYQLQAKHLSRKSSLRLLRRDSATTSDNLWGHRFPHSPSSTREPDPDQVHSSVRWSIVSRRFRNSSFLCALCFPCERDRAHKETHITCEKTVSPYDLKYEKNTLFLGTDAPGRVRGGVRDRRPWSRQG